MKKNIIHISIAGLLILTGCTTPKTVLPITSTPSPYEITADSDSKAQLRLSFHVPANYISKRNRIVITPQLVEGDSILTEYQPLALYSPIFAKKVNRRHVLDDYVDPFEQRAIKADYPQQELYIPYKELVQLPEGIDSAKVVAVVSTDGCGECTGIDTIGIAKIIRPKPELPKEEPKKELVETAIRVRPKIEQGNGVAHLQFVINKYDINPDMGNNRRELEDMARKISLAVRDTTIVLTSLTINGVASADGSLAFNTTLSRNRANAAKEWLIDRLGLSEDVQRIITIGSHPEGWQPVLEAMEADHHPDAPKVKAILDRYANESDDVAERYIRRLACWKDIREKYLQKDRKVEYTYSYYKKSYTYEIEKVEKGGTKQ